MCFIKFSFIVSPAFWSRQCFVKLSNGPRKLNTLVTYRHKKFQSSHLRHHIWHTNHLNWETKTSLTHIFHQYQSIYSYREKNWWESLKLFKCKDPFLSTKTLYNPHRLRKCITANYHYGFRNAYNGHLLFLLVSIPSVYWSPNTPVFLWWTIPPFLLSIHSFWMILIQFLSPGVGMWLRPGQSEHPISLATLITSRMGMD